MGHHTEAFIGLDTSKLRNAVAIAEAGRNGEVRYLGEIPNTEGATGKLVAKLASKYEKLTFCYEAGPTGYGLYRLITSLGHECMANPLIGAPIAGFSDRPPSQSCRQADGTRQRLDRETRVLIPQ